MVWPLVGLTLYRTSRVRFDRHSPFTIDHLPNDVSSRHSREAAGAAESHLRWGRGAFGAAALPVAAVRAQAKAFGFGGGRAFGLAARSPAEARRDLDEPRASSAALALRAARARRLRLPRLLGAVRGRVERTLSGVELQRPSQPPP